MADSVASQASAQGSGFAANETSTSKNNLATILEANFIGTFELPLKNITCTSLVRQVNERGIKTVMASIENKGWLDHYAPAVVIQREALEGSDFTEEAAPTHHYQVLDGNHRITAARRLWGGDHLVSCRVYYALPANVTKIVADQFNDAGESLSTRTLYDRLYCFNEIVEQLKEEHGIAEVSALAIHRAYSQVRTSVPSVQSLRSWKKALGGLSQEAFSAIRDVFQSEEKSVDARALSLNILTTQAFMNLNSASACTQQSFVVHIIVRFKHVYRTAPKQENLDKIIKRASAGVDVLRCAERCIPREEWTEPFQREIDNLTRGLVQDSEFEATVGIHLLAIEEDIAQVRERIPDEDEACSAYGIVARGALPRRLELIAKRSTRMRDCMRNWMTKLESAKAVIARKILARRDEDKRRQEKMESEKEDHEEDSDGHSVRPVAGGRERNSCATREPDKKYEKNRCSEFSNYEKGVEGHKKRKTSTPGLLTPEAKGGVEARSRCRVLNTKIQDGSLLVRGSDLHDDPAPLNVTRAPKLTIVAIDAERQMLSISKDDNCALRRVVQKIIDCLHPQGTVAFGWPRPWHLHGARICDVLSEDPTMIVEDSPLLLVYQNSPARRPVEGTSFHGCNACEAIIIAHKVPGEDKKKCTINERVVPSDVWGMTSGPVPPFLSHMHGFKYPTGAPDEGPTNAFPPRAIQFLVNRFSLPGDTVLGVGVESTHVPEVALDRGRRLELFLADMDSKDRVQERINRAFINAFDEGIFELETSADTMVGRHALPSGVLPGATRPCMLPDEGQEAQDIMRKAAGNSGYEPKVKTFTGPDHDA